MRSKQVSAVREIRTLRSTWRGLETWHGRDAVTPRNRKGEATVNTNIDLNRSASLRPYRGEVTNRVLLGRKRHGRPGVQSGRQRWERPGWQQTRRLEDHRMTAAAKSTPVLKSSNGFWWNSRPSGTWGRPM